MFGQWGTKKEVVLRNFFYSFCPSMPYTGRIQPRPSLVKPLERPFMGVLGKNYLVSACIRHSIALCSCNRTFITA